MSKPASFRYTAFMSYSHGADGRLAPVLQAALHSIARPWYQRRSMHVFRDQTNLSANPGLWPKIEEALTESDFFVLLASPPAAGSTWVEREVSWWLQHRSSDKLLLVVTDGSLVWDDDRQDYDWTQTTALPNGLAGRFPSEPLHVDLRWTRSMPTWSRRDERFRNAVLDIGAPLLYTEKDELDGADIRQQRRNRRLAFAAVSAVALLSLAAAGFGGFAWHRNQLALSRQEAAKASVMSTENVDALPRSALVAARAVQRVNDLPVSTLADAFEANQSLYRILELMGPAPSHEQSFEGLLDIVVGPRGRYAATIPYEGSAEIYEVPGRAPVAALGPTSSVDHLSNKVRGLAFSGDEARVAGVVGGGVSATVWTLPEGEEVFSTPLDGGGVVALSLSDDGRYLATSFTSGEVWVWNVDEGTRRARFDSSKAIMQRLRFGPDGSILAATNSIGLRGGSLAENTLRLLDVREGRDVASLRHSSAITHFAFSPDGKHLVTTRRVGSEQAEAERVGEIFIWALESGELLNRVVHEDVVNGFDFTPDGAYLLSASSDDTARVWDIRTGMQMLLFEHGAPVKVARFASIVGIAYALTAGDDDVARIWVLQSPIVEALRLVAPQSNVLEVVPNDAQLLMLSHDLTSDVENDPTRHITQLSAWPLTQLNDKMRMPHAHVVGGARFSADGLYLATFDAQLPSFQMASVGGESGSTDYTDLGRGGIYVWELPDRAKSAYVELAAAIMGFDFSPDGRHVATASADGYVRVYEVPSSRLKHELRRQGWAFNVAMSPDGQRLATASGSPGGLATGVAEDGSIAVFDMASGRMIAEHVVGHIVEGLEFSGDSRLLATGGFDGTVHVLNTDDGDVIERIGLEKPVRSLGMNWDGTRLAIGTGGDRAAGELPQGGETLVYDLRNGKLATLDDEHTSWVTDVEFSRDGRYAASIDQEGTVGVWDVSDNDAIMRANHGGEGAGHASIAFHQDGRFLVSGSGNTARVWDIRSGTEVARREHAFGNLWEATFSPDGKWIATASTDTTAGLWLWQPADLVEEACHRVSAHLDSYESVCSDAGSADSP